MIHHSRPRLITPFVTLTLALLALVGCRSHSPLVSVPAQADRSIVILYENDVHCRVDGYARLAGLRDAIADTAWTQVVSCGDFIQGGPIGAISKGMYVVNVMKSVGYDALTIGNHGFDFKTPRLLELMDSLAAPVTCVNLIDQANGQPVFAPYVMHEVGGRRIAYVGAVTPTAMIGEAMAFYDERGQQLYDLVPTQVYDRVQQAVDAARAAGADYVVVLSHLGEPDNEMHITSHGLVAATTGIDVVLDGHSHAQIPSLQLLNREGKPVTVTQTGTQFANVGHLLITPDGRLSTRLIPVDSIAQVSAPVHAATIKVQAEAEQITSRIIGQTDVPLRLRDDAGQEIVRKGESNAGDLVSDAFRMVAGTDIGVINAGAIRNELPAGPMTYGSLLSLLPYDNWLCVAEVTGQQVMQMLTQNTALLPNADGQFPAVSGMRYTVNAHTHELTDVEVLDRATGQYLPIDLNRTYTLASTDYAIYMGGMRGALRDAHIVRNAFMHYCDALVEYVTGQLQGHITEAYAEPQGRITVIR